jgi:hypothetical protein
MNRISQYIKSVGGIQQETWNFCYGPTGIDKATRTQGGIQNLSIDYTTDPNGRILSMTYTETGGYSGELLAVSDNHGYTPFYADTEGTTIWGAIFDLNNGSITELYNPYNIKNIFGWNRGKKKFTLEIGANTNIIFGEKVDNLTISSLWGNTDVEAYKGTETYTTDITDKNGDNHVPNCCEIMSTARVYYDLMNFWEDQLKNLREKGYFFFPFIDLSSGTVKEGTKIIPSNPTGATPAEGEISLPGNFEFWESYIKSAIDSCRKELFYWCDLWEEQHCADIYGPISVCDMW